MIRSQSDVNDVCTGVQMWSNHSVCFETLTLTQEQLQQTESGSHSSENGQKVRYTM